MSRSTPTPLQDVLTALIAENGPLSMADYMTLCLSHPKHGYYMSGDPFGQRGDFITAPEISQIFGELVGIWCAAGYRMMGSPPAFNLIEFGPGRGTLMADLLRAAKVMPGFLESAQIHLIEISPALKRNQQIKLQNAGVPVSWHDALSEVPLGPSIIVANEFFDALPVQQFQKTEKGWHERQVGLDDQDCLTIGLAEATLSEAAIEDWMSSAPVGSIAELAPARQRMAAEISRQIVAANGCALIIDYGHVQSAAGDTLQAMSKHGYVDILHRPGKCDLTSHVDFAALKKAIESVGADVYGPVAQGPFLDAMGLDMRAEILCKNASRRQVRAIESGVERLASKAEMGELFKVMAVTSPGLAVPAPFEGLSP